MCNVIKIHVLQHTKLFICGLPFTQLTGNMMGNSGNTHIIISLKIHNTLFRSTLKILLKYFLNSSIDQEYIATALSRAILFNNSGDELW